MTEHTGSDAWSWPAGRWTARWIWAGPPAIDVQGVSGRSVVDPDDAERVVLLRRVFELEAVPREAPARLTADSRYILWVNGVEVARGPVRSHPTDLRVDHLDLAPYLRGGPNTLAVLGRYYGRPTPWWHPVPPTWGLGAGCVALEARIGERSVVSDSSWRGRVAEGWRSGRGAGVSGLPVEIRDDRSLPTDWTDPGFDDDRWAAAVELTPSHVGYPGHPEPPTHPYGPLRPRPIGWPVAADRLPVSISTYAGEGGPDMDDPVRQVRGDEPRLAPAVAGLGGDAFPLDLKAGAGRVELVRCDFGEVVAGTIEIELGADSDVRVDLCGAEAVGLDDTLVQDGQHLGARWRSRGGGRFETLDGFGLRHLALSVRSDTPVSLRAVRVRERLAPRPAGPSFACSDPLLTRIWQVGRRTVDLCAWDSYVDCPTREQRAWTGDAVVHQSVDLVSNPDWRLARWHAEMASATARPDGMVPMAVASDFAHQDATIIPDWALHWVRMVHNLWRYTGDDDLISRLLPGVERVVRWFEPFRGDDGLLVDVNGWVIIDWSAVHTSGTSSVLNALWARALGDLAEMAAWRGDEGRASWARERQQQVAAAFDVFWDDDRGCYVDHLVDGRAGAPASEHASASAVVGGVVPADRLGSVADTLLDREAVVHASWLQPGRDTSRADDEVDMYAGGAYLFAGPSEPWWDVGHRLVAAQPFFRYVVHDAVAAAGRADAVAGLCRDWAVLLDRCGTSFSETWYGGTRAHAWSATPTRDLVVHTLGVRPDEPGWGRGRVAPALGDLAWARASVPTPAGPLDVSVEVVDGRHVIDVDTPVPLVVDAGGGQAVEVGVGRHRVGG